MTVLVAGGGITGIAAALDLGRRGIPTLLVEASDRLGGKLATERVDGFVAEHGPDSFLTTRPAAVRLAREVGLGDRLIPTTGRRAVYISHRGRLVPMPEGLGLVLPTRAWPFAITPLFSPLEKARMALDLVLPRVISSGDEGVGAFLRRRLGNALVDRLAGPLVGGIYGTPIDELSLDAVVPQLRASEAEHRSLLLAGLADGRRVRAAAARAVAAADTSRPALGLFASLTGGIGELVDGASVALGAMASTVRIRTGTEVASIDPLGAGVRVGLSDGTVVRADAAVLALPGPAAASLVEPCAAAAARSIASIPHGASTIVSLGYRRDRVGDALDGHGYLVPAAEGGAISACTWSSEKWPGRAPEGAVLLRAFVADGSPLARADDASIVAGVRADVERTLRIGGRPELVRVIRWNGAMPRYTVGHLGRVAGAEAGLREWPAVVLAGAAYRGVGIPDCISQGLAAAEAVAERLDPALREATPA